MTQLEIDSESFVIRNDHAGYAIRNLVTLGEDSKVFYLSVVHGCTVAHKVFEDGTIEGESGEFPEPMAWVRVLDPQKVKKLLKKEAAQ